MQEKRLVERLKQNWIRLKGDKLMPERQRFNPDVVNDIWSRCIMLEVVTNPNNKTTLYTYDFMGSDIITAYGSDLTGHYVNVHMHNFPGWQVLKSVDAMLEKPDIFLSEGSFVSDAHMVIRYRACLLPFGTEKRVTHVLVGLSWKEF